MSSVLNAQLYEFDDPSSGFWRYCRVISKTLVLLIRCRPGTLFVQNPSLLLSVIGILWGKVTGAITVVDAHNAGLFPLEGRSRMATSVAKWVAREAPLTLVTNPPLQRYVASVGGRAAVLPDPLPVLSETSDFVAESASFSILFVCTWAADEPYLEVFQAAEMLPDDVHFFVTGRSHGRETAYGKPLPSNVHLTGFVEEDAYVSMLRNVDLVLDLTDREDCLVCGAYEAVAAGTPMILSNTLALRSYFDGGSLFTRNTAEEIAHHIRVAQRDIGAMRAQVSELRSRIAEREVHAQARVEAALAGLTQPLRTRVSSIGDSISS